MLGRDPNARRFSKPPPESGSGVTLFAFTTFRLGHLQKNRASRNPTVLGPVVFSRPCSLRELVYLLHVYIQSTKSCKNE